MSELKAFDTTVAEEGYCNGVVKYRRAVYDKSEADKVIAELEDKILQYKVLYKEKCRDINTQERFFAQERAHDKYKRCLAMARWCYDRWIRTYHMSKLQKTKFYLRWQKRWEELAEKFKEAK